MKSKREVFNLKDQLFLPSPASFSPKLQLVKEKSPSPLMGTQKREELDSRKNYPGVGNYDIRAKKTDGPSYMYILNKHIWKEFI